MKGNMISAARKLHVIEEVLKVKSEAILSEVEAVLKKTSKPDKTRKLSEKYAGSLQLTDKQYADFQNQINQSRSGWGKNI